MPGGARPAAWSPRSSRSCARPTAPGSAGPASPTSSRAVRVRGHAASFRCTLSAEDVELYYEGFSNDTIWPLYHDVIAEPRYRRVWWDAYVRVNRRFAEAAAEAAAEGATVWVQDYQLQLVPRMLRELRPDLTIGYFHHIPFPAYGLYSQLPWRRQVLEGLLGADVIGFQRVADAGNFARAVRRQLRYETKASGITVPDGDGTTRLALAKAFPISIDASSYIELAQREDVQGARAGDPREPRQPEAHPPRRRPARLHQGHPAPAQGLRRAARRRTKLSVEDVTLVQVASPSRERVAAYIQLRDEIELTVGRINGDFDTMGHTAIRYLHQAYPREEMVALFLAADVMLVTALRDGMNLVAKEYVASRVDNRGVLILSEFAGAADELGSAVRVNPARHRGAEGRHDARSRDAAGRAGPAHARRCAGACSSTASRTGRASSSRRWRRSTRARAVTDRMTAAPTTRACTMRSRGSRHPIACWSRSTSTARSRRSRTSR